MHDHDDDDSRKVQRKNQSQFPDSSKSSRQTIRILSSLTCSLGISLLRSVASAYQNISSTRRFHELGFGASEVSWFQGLGFGAGEAARFQELGFFDFRV